MGEIAESSSVGEFHPHALSEPDVNSRTHLAAIDSRSNTALPYVIAPPIAG